MKSKSLLLINFWLISTLFLGGCGQTGNTDPTIKALPKLNGVEYLPLDRGTLDTGTADKVKGTGSLIFRKPRPEDDSNYQLNFQLEPKGSLTLVTNSNEKLQQGANITFSRPTAGKQLVVKATVGGKNFDYSPDFAAQDASAPLSFNLDVHGHGHIKFFYPGGKVDEYGTPKVSAQFYGLILNNATVTALNADKAKPD